MKETVTVEEALSEGRWKLKHLPMIVTFSFIAVGFILYYVNLFDGWIIAVGFISGFLSGWLIWSYFVNKWKIWAFENVRNVHTLQRKAIEEKLIWKSGSWFEKTEFKNYDQKQKLKQLETKFLEKDVFKDDISVPKETIVFYSKTTLLFLLIMSLGMISIGIYFGLQKKYLGLFILAIGLYLMYDQIKKLRDNSPQIIINDKGIKLKNEKIISWNKIYNDRVFTKSSGKSSTNYLAFNDELIDLSELTVEFEELDNLLRIYRVRFEKNN